MGAVTKHGRLWRPGDAPIAFRRQEVLRLWNDGCSTAQIAAALSISQDTANSDLREMAPGHPKRYRGTAQDPPPVDWLNPPAVLSGPADRPALAVRHFLAEMEAARWQPAHAHDVIDARRRGDTGWLAAWEGLTAQLRHVATTLEDIHESPGAALAAVPAPGPPRSLREAVERRIAAGLPQDRAGMAREYGTTEQEIRNQWNQALGRAEERQRLLDAGWSPPP